MSPNLVTLFGTIILGIVHFKTIARRLQSKGNHLEAKKLRNDLPSLSRFVYLVGM